MEIELRLTMLVFLCLGIIWIVKTILLGKLYQVGCCHEVLLVLWCVITETALVTGNEVLVLWHTASQPLMSASILQIPYLLVVDESDAESFCRTILLDELAQACSSLTSGVNVWQNDIVGAVLGKSILHVWVKGKCFIA